MLPELTKIKGVHPGAVLSRELKKRGWGSKQLALSLGEYPQTISAISKGKRRITPALSIKLGKIFDTSEAYFILLQAYYDLEKERKKILLEKQATPDLSKFTRAIFWDTDIEKIEWEKQKKAVICRIFERGNEIEIHEILSFYGINTVKKELKGMTSHLPAFTRNIHKYLSEDI